jgi:5-methylthioadenosine/S-adenosylhomocysteine deaminase
LASISLPAHSPYTCSPEVLREVGVLARKLDIPATIHLAETAWEDGEMKSKYGKSSTQLLADLGFFDGKSVAYHCNHLSLADIELLRDNNVGIITNPHSNMKLGSGICPVPELIEEGLTIGIGTDGPASNNKQCMLLDMQFLARLHKMNKLDPTVLNARQVIKMATYNGAKNYGLDNELGTLEKGKLADLMIIDTEQAHWIPLNDPYSQIVYSMQPGDVNCTIINGKLIMEDRKIITVDEEYFISEISQLGKKITSQS